MLNKNSFDTICHEHLEYYSVSQIKHICQLAGFKIIDISLNESNGGSFRCFVSKRSSPKFEETSLVKTYLDLENQAKLSEDSTYFDFMNRCDNQMNKLKMFLECVKNNNQQTWVYGASTKGNTLLQYKNMFDVSLLSKAVERNPQKFGKMTPGTHIPIISEYEMRNNPPEYLLVLPWHFSEEIIQREKEYLDQGGCLIFPLPEFRVYSRKPIILMTGVDGQIGRSVVEEFSKDRKIFGISRQETHLQTHVTYVNCDLMEKNILEKWIETLKPSFCVI